MQANTPTTRFVPASEAVLGFVDDNRRRAGNVLMRVLGREVPLDENAAEAVDELIDETGRAITPDQRDGAVGMLGAFLGEAVIATFGGEWVVSDDAGTIGVLTPDGSVWFVFEKLASRIERVESDSLAAFWQSVAARERNDYTPPRG